MKEEQTIKFDRDRATKYDKDILKVIPGYKALHDMANGILGASLPESASLLVVGSGTGKEILNLSQSYPHWEFMGVEPSSEMTAIAQTRFTEKRLLQRIESHLGYISIEEYEADFQRSLNSIHFIPETRIFKLLEEAGFSEIVKFYNAFLFGGWTAKLGRSLFYSFPVPFKSKTSN